MKKFAKEFLLRGLIAASGGPIVLAVIYGVLGATGTVSSLSPREVCLGILTIALLAFTVAGMTAIYQMERLPLISGILIHGAVLYAVYVLIYLINGWLQRQWTAVLVFTAVFLAGYALIWMIIYIVTKRKTQQLNQKLKTEV